MAGAAEKINVWVQMWEALHILHRLLKLQFPSGGTILFIFLSWIASLILLWPEDTLKFISISSICWHLICDPACDSF